MTPVRTTSDNPDFQKLIGLLDQFLKIVDGDDHAFFAQYNKVDMIKHVVVCYENEIAVGCGAFKEFDESTAEIKRMFVLPEYRGKGIAGCVLSELETWAKELEYTVCILETGQKMKSAIALYLKSGFEKTEAYGQYIGVENSVCMRKNI